MRKSKKAEIHNCIHTLKEANRKLKTGSINIKNNILPQCQEAAVMIGTGIDEAEGEGTQAVSYLEDYCEELYRAYAATDQASCREIYKRIDKLLDQVDRSVWHDIPDSPNEIVFMPYKAAMWDALDSVYRAAVQEEDCHVVVMPIPYYNANRKDQQVELHYEAGLFPEDIQITDYRTYDLQKIHPDVIFIHNPYDEYNYVTQVPQEYFSSSLVQYTDHLVYIPYFITKGDTVKPQYCIMPAVRNAWKTIVQSEAVRKEYIRNGADPTRIVALGSPKFDMVIRMQDNPPDVPEEWREALKGRKVFLLNTHLNPIINEAEKVIDKLQQIIRLFRKREDAALLWRPHPLSVETAKAMNPDILDGYMKVVDEFKTLPNGVYDETPDVHRAIALSDAYIGDKSSLVTLYGVTGKPMYILNIKAETNIVARNQWKYLSFSCGVVYKGELWVSSDTHNGLYRINLNTYHAKFVTCFNREQMNIKTLYSRMVVYHDDIYLIPYRAKYIGVYHINTGTKDYIIPHYDLNLVKFSEALVYNNFLFLFPTRVSCIIRLNMDNGEMNYYTECCSILESLREEYAIFLNGIRIENKAWIACRKVNCFVEFNLDNLSSRIHYIKKSNHELMDVVGNESNLYLLTAAGEVLEWNISTEEERILWKDKTNMGGVPFNRLIYTNDSLWLLPCLENKIVKICIDSDFAISEYSLPPEYEVWDCNMPKTRGYIPDDTFYVICPAQANLIACIVNEENSIGSTISYREVCKEDLERYYRYLYEEGEKFEHGLVFYESVCPAESFLNIVIDSKEKYSDKGRRYFRNMQSNLCNDAGMQIWKYVFHEL